MSASHGNTPAAWTAVSIMFVGFLISGLALPLELPWLFFVGLVVVALGAVTGKVMSMMGMDAFALLCRTEGIIPAIESAHAMAGAMRVGRELGPDATVLVNLSGRGDKDVETAGSWLLS